MRKVGAFEEEMIEGEGGMREEVERTVWRVGETHVKEVIGQTVVVES